MFILNRDKFRRNKDLKERLLATKNQLKVFNQYAISKQLYTKWAWRSAILGLSQNWQNYLGLKLSWRNHWKGKVNYTVRQRDLTVAQFVVLTDLDW